MLDYLHPALKEEEEMNAEEMEKRNRVELEFEIIHKMGREGKQFCLKSAMKNVDALVLEAHKAGRVEGLEEAALIAEKAEVYYSPHAKDSDANLSEWIKSVKHQLSVKIRRAYGQENKLDNK